MNAVLIVIKELISYLYFELFALDLMHFIYDFRVDFGTQSMYFMTVHRPRSSVG